MTTQANSQFLRPDFHRQDMRPHGLQAKNAKAAREAGILSVIRG